MDGESRAIYVSIGEMRVANPPGSLTAVGLGSCVAVVIQDQKTNTGGMAHIMLPWVPKRLREGMNLFKYADYAIEKMVEQIEALGGARKNLQAKIVGGAHMFIGAREDFPMNVGLRNVQAVKRKLHQLEIPVVSEDTGGGYGRSVEVTLGEGVVRVRSLRKGFLVI